MTCARANLLLIPLDDRAGVVPIPPPPARPPSGRAAPSRRASAFMRCMRARAAWHGSHADDETALEYAMLAGDVDLAARLLPQTRTAGLQLGAGREPLGGGSRRSTRAACRFITPTSPSSARSSSRCSTIRRRPITGRSTSATRRPTLAPDAHAMAMLRFGRAFLCRSGVEQMRADAEAASRPLRKMTNRRRLSLLMSRSRGAGIDRSRAGGRHVRRGRA